MAGIGVKLTNIYKKNTLTTDIIGVGYSMVVTIAPMLVVIGALVLMEYFLDFSSVAYITRELFSCTVLYIFIFFCFSITEIFFIRYGMFLNKAPLVNSRLKTFLFSFFFPSLVRTDSAV